MKSLAVLVLLFFFVYLFGIKPYEEAETSQPNINTQSQSQNTVQTMPDQNQNTVQTMPLQNKTNEQPIWPYQCPFRITQDIHGFGYGHMAVDIANGRDTPVYSPISGQVNYFIDEDNNTNLIIKNDVYEVQMLHGNWNVYSGQVKQGDLVGYESNKGYVSDMNGNLCQHDNCGFHTHFNIKWYDTNVNPFSVITVPTCQ